jgi:Signal transduction histidine kinase
MTLNKRLILYNGATIIIPLLITAIVSYMLIYLSPYIFGRKADYNSVKNLTTVTYEILGADNGMLVERPDILLDGAYQDYMAAKLNSVGASLIIAKNKDKIYSSKDFSKIELQKCLNATEGEISNAVVKLDDCSYFIRSINVIFSDKENGKVFMLTPIDNKGLTVTKIILVDGILFLLCYLLINAIYSYIIVKKVTRPLKSLQIAADRISNGDLEEEIYEQGEEEIRVLCRSFEEMRIKLKEAINTQEKYDKNRTMLLSSISHDLRTPITTIKGYVEGIRDGVADTQAKKERYLNTVYQKACLVDEMIDDILLYSKLDLNQLPYDFKKVDIYEYLNDMVTDYEATLIKDHINITLTNDTHEKAFVLMDTNRMVRVFNNLIDNSKKYMKNSDGQIQIIIRETKTSIIIELKDNGIGIEASALPNIFERFYRADAARSNASGSGLGLAICRQIVEGHGGRIWAKSILGEGTSIMIALNKV